MKRQVIVAIITVIFLVVVGTLVASTDAKGQTPREPSHPLFLRSLSGEPAPPPGFALGTITALSNKAIAIDGKKYSLDAGLVLQDEHGRAWAMKNIGPGVEIMFRRTGKQVDHIVILLPR